MNSATRQEVLSGAASVAQRSLWFLDRMAQGRPLNALAWRIELAGDLDVDALRAAFESVVRRHDSLRTRFEERGHLPVRSVEDEVELPFAFEDLRATPVAERTRTLERRCAEDVEAGFDLAVAPLLRVRLLRTGETSHHLLIVVHHIVFDAVSLDLLLGELDDHYGRSLRGETPSGAPLPTTYARYCEEQHELLVGPRREKLAAYWRERLDDVPRLLELPTDRPRGPVQLYDNGEHTLRLDAGLSEKLRAFARAERTTAFSVLLAGFQLLLARLSGQRDVVVGTPASGRTRSELEPLIGFLVNMVVLRGRVGESDTFRTLVKNARRTVFSALDHQQLPFDTVVDELKPDRALSHNPLFQVQFGMRTQGEGTFDALPVRKVTPVDNGHSQYELTVAVVDGNDCIDVVIEYAPSLYDTASAIALGEQYRRLLASAVAEPDGLADALDLLGPVARHQVLHGWNDTGRMVEQRTMPQLFEAAAARFPDTPAVVAGEEQLDYRELNARANRLARLLIARGVGPEDIVAGALPRSVDYAVAFMGATKAGAAYQPLDLKHPQERLRTVLADTRPAVVLSLGAAHPATPGTSLSVVLDSPDVQDELAQAAPHDVTDAERRVPLRLAHPAYVIHTSGSTGRPKGVIVQHQGLATLTWNQVEVLGVVPGESRVLQFASPAFDGSMADLTKSLLSGATLVLPLDEERTPGPPLQELMHKRRITHTILPPAVLSVMDPEHALPAGTVLCVAGEACPGDVVGRWSAGRKMFNEYGPTETTVVSTMSGRLSGNGAPPLGRPLWNTQVYVLDHLGNPVPPEVAGELYVGGTQLARGYLNRPALTAAAFVPDPYGSVPGGRLYRTGDRVRRRRDGSLEYLGRVDDQVKIRGYRIEPGEVTGVLLEHPEVTSATVTVREDTPGERRLVGYAVPAAGSSLQTAELRAYLAARLPDYLVPSAFVLLDAIPVTHSGKVDRKSLPEPPAVPCSDGVRPARTAVERLVVAVWGDILGIDTAALSCDDDFFAVGGHSLSAVAVAATLQELLDLPLTAAAVFHAPTPERLAERLASDLGGAERAEAVAGPLVQVLEMTDEDALARLAQGADRI
ncbi:hypothetical protein GCM10010329_38020 [Streptomyces spiroverticillatus]|uniref:Carrier domain-containing protein n=1 Tax=Streptomyces finlayi TaxID=67296 RepID=A0A918WY66_9ACTN|nr:non-ribosomal peptide synthetase [Streptomyces finlayi]GHA11520.1 hypothetical protein GCM10010329_38020 [Streptomyces spiroverticillatus]GHC94965.1 hypothetical protein GCM10010334_33590 [Streptomyces finlayi]